MALAVLTTGRSGNGAFRRGLAGGACADALGRELEEGARRAKEALDIVSSRSVTTSTWSCASDILGSMTSEILIVERVGVAPPK